VMLCPGTPPGAPRTSTEKPTSHVLFSTTSRGPPHQ
jgi:hypothetical protein